MNLGNINFFNWRCRNMHKTLFGNGNQGLYAVRRYEKKCETKYFEAELVVFC